MRSGRRRIIRGLARMSHQPRIQLVLMQSIGLGNHVAAHKSASTYDISYVFPIYLYSPQEGEKAVKTDLFGTIDPFEGRERIENVAPQFRAWADEQYKHHLSPEEVFGYIYAVVHSSTYRARYAEFLRADFPRIPFPCP